MHHDVTHHAALALIWNRLHHHAWEPHRVTRNIGQTDGRNPYPPRPRTATVERCKALDTSDTIHQTARIIGARYPDEHPGLAHAIAIELDRDTFETWLRSLTHDDFAAFNAAITTWPNAYEAKENRHGNMRTRIVAPIEAVTIGLTLAVLADVRPFDERDIEPAFICEGDLLELERIAAGKAVNPTRKLRRARLLRTA